MSRKIYVKEQGGTVTIFPNGKVQISNFIFPGVIGDGITPAELAREVAKFLLEAADRNEAMVPQERLKAPGTWNFSSDDGWYH